MICSRVAPDGAPRPPRRADTRDWCGSARGRVGLAGARTRHGGYETAFCVAASERRDQEG